MGHVEFGAEFMDLPADNKGLFPDNWFEDGRAEYRYEEIDPRRLMIVTVDDPSMGLPDGDPSAIGTIGWDPYQGHFLVLECYIERVRPEVNALTVKAQAAPYPSSTLVVESTLFQDLLRKAIAKHCKGMPVMRFERYTPKELDIGALSPLIEMGLIKFDVRRGHTRTLIDQLRGYGEPGMHDDGPDMLSIGIQHLQYRLAGDKNDYQTVAKREVYEAVREF
jgi:predicted phage terminase large subunit-like protein